MYQLHSELKLQVDNTNEYSNKNKVISMMKIILVGMEYVYNNKKKAASRKAYLKETTLYLGWQLQ